MSIPGQALSSEQLAGTALSRATSSARGVIEIGPHAPAEAIGRWRVADQSPQARVRPIREALFGVTAAVTLNAVLLYLIVSGIGFGAPQPGGPRPVLDADTETIRAYLIEASNRSPPPEAAGELASPIEPAGPRSELPKKSIETDNNSSRNRDAVTRVIRESTAQSETERLQAIYRAQISARLKRSLEAAHLSPRRRCSIQISQGPTGVVVGVADSHCGEDEQWQSRLIAAIKEATPLPIPPRADLFQSRLTVEFIEGVDVTW
jgi:hypothetical protein